MTTPPRSLFTPVADTGKLHPNFVRLRDLPSSEAARKMLDDIFQGFDDPDGNFVEQFHTTGFDSRYFEIYLFAYFSLSGFNLQRPRPAPDFLVSRNGMTVAVEATTVNPSQSGVLSELGRKISDLTIEEIADYVQNELAIRFGSPLFSKLKKHDWELEHCHNMPFVLAIQSFHDDESLLFSDGAVWQFLYGLRQSGEWGQKGELRLSMSEIEKHQLGSKVIPSNFFAHPDTENISAVIFTNCGTQGKFSRMGYQSGYGCETLHISRQGTCFNPDPTAMDATLFSYNMDAPPFVEKWGQGLVVFHNPRCRRPVPPDFFPDAVQGYIESGTFKTEYPNWHPFGSITHIVHLGEKKEELLRLLFQTAPSEIRAISKERFHAAWGFDLAESNPLAEEHGWFSDDTESFLGVVIRDKTDEDWSYVVLARDDHFQFGAMWAQSDFISRDEARTALQAKMLERVRQPQRIFPGGVETV